MAVPELQTNFHGHFSGFVLTVYSFENQFFLGESLTMLPVALQIL